MPARKLPKDYHKLAESRGIKWLGPEVPNTYTKTWWECSGGHQWDTRYNSVQQGSGCPHCVGLACKIPEDYQKLAQKRGFVWMGPEVPSTSTKTKWQCKQDHQWVARYDSIRRGDGCPHCANRFPKAIGDYHDLAKKRGFKWVGKELPKNISAKTYWRCSKGHKWKADYNHIQRGRGCPNCAHRIPKTIEDYYNLAKGRGFEWIGKKLPKNINTKTFWKCPESHEWGTGYSNIQCGSGCPNCAGLASKISEDYHRLARERGLKWIGEELPKNINTKTFWKCSEGHVWETRYHSIQGGRNCLYCVGKAPKTIEDYHGLARERSFEWLGDKLPVNIKTKTLWKCLEGHIWEACYNSIQQGSGCIHCLDIVNGVQVSKPQRRICEMLKGMLNYPCGSYRIDVALLDRKIAVEYDCWYWHGRKQDYDTERDRFLLANGWKVLHVKTKDCAPSEQELRKAIAKFKNGESLIEIVLDDWGIGPTFMDRYNAHPPSS